MFDWIMLYSPWVSVIVGWAALAAILLLVWNFIKHREEDDG